MWFKQLGFFTIKELVKFLLDGSNYIGFGDNAK